MPKADFCCFARSFITSLSHSPLVSLRLPPDIFRVIWKLGISSTQPTRRTYRAGKQVKRERELKRFIPLGYVNARPIRNKTARIQQHIESLDLDVLTITETRAKDALDGDDHLRRACPGYSFLHTAREKRNGGGVAIIHRSTIGVAGSKAASECSSFSSFEFVGALLCVNPIYIDLLVIYRPPLNSISLFLEEFSSLLERLASSTTKTIIVGDFNIHLDKKKSSSVAEEFCSLIGSFGWFQHAEGPTHTDGHTLDLVISRAADKIVARCNVAGLFSDHLAINIVVRAHRPVRRRKKISFRSIKKINMEAFRLDLIDLPLITNPAAEVDGLIDQYNVGLASLLDKHAPLRQREITVRPENFWTTGEIEATRRTARMVERRWRSRRLEIDKQLLRYWRDRLVLLCDEAKVMQLSALISECGSDQKALFRAVGDRLLVKAERKLPEHDSLQELADDFITFFSKKPADLRADLDMRETGGNHLDDLLSPAVADEDCLFYFPPVSRTDVIDIVKLCPTKSCSLDPIPTALLKSVIDILATPIALLYNLSVSSGMFPSKLKLGFITPLLKKSSLCPNQKANFRPVTNVSFSSKCLERLAFQSLVRHLSVNNLFVPVQSAYRASIQQKRLYYASTTTCSLRLTTEMLRC